MNPLTKICQKRARFDLLSKIAFDYNESISAVWFEIDMNVKLTNRKVKQSVIYIWTIEFINEILNKIKAICAENAACSEQRTDSGQQWIQWNLPVSHVHHIHYTVHIHAQSYHCGIFFSIFLVILHSDTHTRKDYSTRKWSISYSVHFILLFTFFMFEAIHKP